MIGYNTGVDIDGETIYLNGAFFLAGKDTANDDIGKYVESLEGDYLRRATFRKGPVKGMFVEFDGDKRISMVLINTAFVTHSPVVLASAHAYSHEESKKMMRKFKEVTGFSEFDVTRPVNDFFMRVEEKAVRLPGSDPEVMI
jgi:hypothetical protein